MRWFAAAALDTLLVVAVPKFVVAVASRTPASMTAVVELGVAVIVQLRYGVICCDPTLRLAAAPDCTASPTDTAIRPPTVNVSRLTTVMDRSGRGR
jgi:hypothetical protein